MNLKIIAFLALCDLYFAQDCDQNGPFCQIKHWAQWSGCSSTCGAGVIRREKYLCCDLRQYNNLQGCLMGCNITNSWWQTNSVETKTCGHCSHNGVFNSSLKKCQCKNTFGGMCCDVITTRHPTTTVMTTRRRFTTKPTTTTQKPTTRQQTTRATVTRKPTTFLLKSSSSSPLFVQSTTQTFNCNYNPCKNGACAYTGTKVMCVCSQGYEGRYCETDKDECASEPCVYGKCYDEVNNFHCDCPFLFSGKRCARIKTWVVGSIAGAILLALIACCYCLWYCLPTRDRDEDEEATTVTATRNKIRPLPMPKPRYHDW